MPDARRLTDDELLAGLWWADPEWPDWVEGLWRDYVSRMHEWDDYRKSVATVLRSLSPNEVEHG